MIINLTKHPITTNNGTVYPPSGEVARAKRIYTVQGWFPDGTEIVSKKCVVTGLPAPKRGVYYLVSTETRLSAPRRIDLFSPGFPIKDENGEIISSINFVCNDKKKVGSLPSRKMLYP